MRRERFADEAADIESTQAGSQDSVSSHGEMIIILFNILLFVDTKRTSVDPWTLARSVI